MPFKGLLYDAFLFPMELAWFRRWRGRLLSELHGEVLEIGPGTGVNLRYYPSAIDRLTVIDPDPLNIRRFCRRAHERGWDEKGGQKPLCWYLGRGENLPFPDSTFDFIVMSLVLCTVEDPKKVVSEASRVLKDDGRVLVMEHQLPGKEPQAAAFRAAAPIWSIPSGCRLDRRTEDVLRGASDLKMLKAEHRGPLLGRPFLIAELVRS